MQRRQLSPGHFLVLGLAALTFSCSGSDGAPGPAGPAGPTAINASTTSFELLSQLDVVATITDVKVQSPPVVTFTMTTAEGVPITGLRPYWVASSRFVRFTITKLVPGQNGDPDSWVAYVRDANSGEPDYDTGSSLVDNGDGSYTFTFETDVENVNGVPFEPALTHRVAGQIGRYATVPLEEQNPWHDFVPDGRPVSRMRNISTMRRCNECHDNLVFHGRRFEVEYCVQCHNPDLAQGEGDLAFMIHRIHNAGTFSVLDGGISYAEVTYPQDLANCRKCHDEADPETPQADNWNALPHMTACNGCHDIFGPNATNVHSGPVVVTNNAVCVQCHTAESTIAAHTTPNATPNNPELLPGQRNITYELVEAAVDGATNDVTIRFRILSDGSPLDVTNLPMEFKNASGSVFRYPGLLLAYAMAQDGITTPADYNNFGRRGGQPLSHGIDDFAPIETGSPIGTLSYDAGTGVNTATITDGPSQFPAGATLRAVGLQGYLRQDLDGDGSYDVSLHTPSAVVAVTGDDERRSVVDNASCASCHESFEGHGGNRVYDMAICTLCHVPNMSSSGRTIDPATVMSELSPEEIAIIGTDPLAYPEDAQNFKDMIHGIHSSGFRERKFEHVRGPSREGYYDWSHVTFPRGASTSNCKLCHKDESYRLPLVKDLLPTTVRTTAVLNGQDPDKPTVDGAFDNVPNRTDWVNTAAASACFYCHTSIDAWGHMAQNGGLLSIPGVGGPWTNRSGLGGNLESCTICHGPGRVADVDVVHDKR